MQFRNNAGCFVRLVVVPCVVRGSSQVRNLIKNQRIMFNNAAGQSVYKQPFVLPHYPVCTECLQLYCTEETTIAIDYIFISCRENKDDVEDEDPDQVLHGAGTPK